MWRSQISRGLLITLCAAPVFAQTFAIQVSSPQDVLLCGQTIPLTATALDPFGATLGMAPQWQSLNGAVAAVDQNGNVQGLLPGVVTILATDPVSGVSGGYMLRVEPLRVDVTPARPVMHVGDTLQLAAVALDVSGNPLSGVNFIWYSGIPGIASVASDGTVSALRTGVVTISAAIDAGASGLDFSAGVEINIYRKPDFKLTPLVSSDAPAGGTPAITVPQKISASGDNYLAAIVDLSTGGQGLVLSSSGTLQLLGATGQLLPGPNRVINRFTGVSVNASGDVAATVQFSAEYCDSALVLYHQSQAAAVLDRGCNLSITEGALANNDDVIYFLENNGNHFYIHHAGGGRTLVLQRGDKISDSLVVGSLGRASFTSTGAAILEIYPNGAPQQFWRWNGTSLEKMAALNDSSTNGRILNMDFPIESGTGAIYSRIGQSDGPVRVMQYNAGSWTTVVQANTQLGSMRVGWLHRVAPAGKDGSIAIVGDLPKGTSVFRLTQGDPDVLAVVSSWSNVTQLAGGATGVFDAGLISGTPAVYKLASGTGPAPAIASGQNLGTPVPGSLVWDNLPERGSAAAPLVRLPGDGLARVSQGALQPVVTPGSTVRGDTVYSLGGVAASPDGKSAVLSAQTSGGAALLQIRDGVASLIGDTNSNRILGIFGEYLSWFDTGGSSPYAMNANGQFLAMANINYAALWRFDPGTPVQPQRIAIMQQPSPAGVNYNWVNNAALDASGNAAFVANLTDGSNALFLWTNGQVQKLLRSGETGLNGRQIAGFNSVQFAGTKLIVRVNYQGTSVIQSFDGTNWMPVVSQGDVLSFGRSIDNFVSGNIFADDAGDIVYEARTLGFPSVLVRTHDGRDLVAATASDPLPDGSWPLFFYGFNFTSQGNVLFVAESFKDGKERLTLYSGVLAN